MNNGLDTLKEIGEKICIVHELVRLYLNKIYSNIKAYISGE